MGKAMGQMHLTARTEIGRNCRQVCAEVPAEPRCPPAGNCLCRQDGEAMES